MTPDGVTTSAAFPIPERMKAWVLDGPGEVRLTEKPVPVPGRAEVLLRIDAVAICPSDIDNIWYGWPAIVDGGPPFNKNWTPGHEYMGTVVALGPAVDEFAIGERVAVEIHAGCGQCRRCRAGLYTSCLNYGNRAKGHRANGFTTDGGFCEFQVNHVNTMARLSDDISDELGTLVVTAGTAMYALTEIGGLIAGESLVVIGEGPIGLFVAAVGKALGASPVVVTGLSPQRLAIAKGLGADHVIDVRDTDAVAAVKAIVGELGADYVVECSGAPVAIGQAIAMASRGSRVCLAAFPAESTQVDVGRLVRDNIALFGIRGEGKRAVHRACALMRDGKFDARPLHTHTFALDDLPTALHYAKDKLDGAIKVVVKARGVAAGRVAAE
ncbi:alcohol dehydrogenase catalytic domain-containing protein [Rhodoplanes sp. TEM]|uniref:Alcohol dehydrogenase catalytic domain-containing protein n=1 Tax=Rhodoplanes tepidamans TaxID=200616 RepID=A0ABT5J8Z7_RHOTP|nr:MULTISPECIES: zinc-binding dehydrogenase [Rhodoplanes]MDC7786068.1 alcohol dehydrogenase catalytic domain-containing protein [Rhodoplanes tepidamans]MDC7983791.1 alcohol dehydrogenase catalytic domain-containing protein [Rhodoplanes sp. TEM]MDQ0354911.1 L-iditol 2-dehydrogenase [Rhodoplanes tepidamans]